MEGFASKEGPRLGNATPRRVLEALCGVFCLGASLNLLGLLLYVWSNRSGHTSLNPYLCLIVFVPCALLGLGLAVTDRGARRLAGLSISLGAFGALALLYFDRANVLLPYEVWIQRGMP